MSEFENLQFSPDLKPKKAFDWWRFAFNAVWISVLSFLVVLASLSFFAYWNVYKSIPVDTAEFFVIFDKNAYQKNDDWQNLGDSFISHYFSLEKDIWRSLLEEGQYFFGVYLDKLEDTQAKLVLFSYTTLPDDLLLFLQSKEVPYAYKNRILIINSADLEQKNKVLPSLFMANNLCFGRFKADHFSCDKIFDSIKVTVIDKDYQNQGQAADPFNMDSLSENLIYADSQAVFSAEISENWLKVFPFLDKQSFSCLFWEGGNSIFANEFALFLENIDHNSILADIQYYFAYQNRQTRETFLSDGSRYQDEVLDLQKYSWQNYDSFGIPAKRLLVSAESEEFLYAYPFSGNLILTSRSDLLSPQNLFLSEDFSRVKNFSYRKILMRKMFWQKFFPFEFVLENCENLKIEYQNSNYNFSLCD
jgi:hypothetical protein